MKALLRRSSPGLFEDNIEHGEIKISLSERLVTRNGIAVNLGPKEFKIFISLPFYCQEELKSNILVGF